MGLQNFGKSKEVASAAETLSKRLLGTQILITRQYRVHPVAMVFGPGKEPVPDETIREPSEPIRDEISIPYYLYRGVYGAGVIIVNGEEHPLLLCNENIAPSQPTSLREIKNIQGLENLIPGMREDQVLRNTMVWGIETPVPHYGPGGPVECSRRSGTFGALVTTPEGKVGVLTAGHVGIQLGAKAWADGKANGKIIGEVTYTKDPATQLPGTPSADVAVITIEDASVNVFKPTIKIGKTIDAKPADKLENCCARQHVVDGVMAFADFVFIPSMAAPWGKVYMTQGPISVQGDSGAPVLLEGTDLIVGHIVGGSPNSTSFIQDIDYQLQDCGCTLLP